MIKKLDPSARFKVICVFDDSLISESAEELAALKEKNEESRYSKYLEKFDESLLQFKPDAKPTYFVVRGLTHSEQAAMNEKYYIFDTSAKHMKTKGDRIAMYLEMFRLGCVETEDAGLKSPLDPESIPFNIAAEVGSIVHLISILSKSAKNG